MMALIKFGCWMLMGYIAVETLGQLGMWLIIGFVVASLVRS